MGLLSENEREIEETFRDVHEAGISLLCPPSSTKELLKLLDKSEKLMAKMEQSSSEQTKQALFPIMRALKSPGIFRSSDMDVKMSVLSCISKMIRITAPDAPYNDCVLKEFFHMLLQAFASLSEMPGSHRYAKAASMLEIAAEVRFCLLMLDLQLDKLVIEMFQLFLKTISSDHPSTLFNHMESVLTMLVDESEFISLELLSSLLASLQMNNQNFSLASWKLSERILRNCAAKLQPYIKKAVHSSQISLDDYFQIVTFICESGHVSEEDRVGGSGENDVIKTPALNDGCPNEINKAMEEATIRNDSSPKRNDDILITEKSPKTFEPCNLNKIITEADELDSMKVTNPETNTETAPKKRNWKPNTKTLPDEGYSHYWESTEKKTRCRKSHEKGFSGSHSSTKVALPEDQGTELLVSEAMGALLFSQNKGLPEGSCRRRGRPKKTPNMLSENGDVSITSASKVDLLKRRVKEEIMEYADVCLEKEPNNAVFLEPNQDLSIRDECVVKDTPKRRRKRKPTVGKKEASTMDDVDKQLIGEKIKVWWPLDKKFYFGVVHSFDPETKKHKVLYTDGEEETLNLKEERWEPIGVDIPRDGEQEAELPKPDASSSIPPKRKYVRKSGSAEQAKTGPSPKRRRPRSKRIEIDSEPEPEDHVTNVRFNGQTSTATSPKPSTPETVIIFKVESSEKPDVCEPGSNTPEADVVSNAMPVQTEAVSPRHGSESGGAEVCCSGQ